MSHQLADMPIQTPFVVQSVLIGENMRLRSTTSWHQKTTAILLSIVCSVVIVSPSSAAPMRQPDLEAFGPFDSGSFLSAARAYDVTGDNWPDLVTRNASTGELSVHVHSGAFSGTSTYLPQVVIGQGWNTYNWIGIGNFVDSPAKDGTEEDEKESYLGDIIARKPDGTLWLYPHSGTFSGPTTWTGPYQVGTGYQDAYRLWPTDADNDGYDDLLWMNKSLRLIFQRNTRFLNGPSTFGAQVPASPSSRGPSLSNTDFWFLTNWYSDMPDFAVMSTDDLQLTYYANSHGQVSEDSWPWGSLMRRFNNAPEVFAYDRRLGAAADVTGDGTDDIVAVKRNGELWAFRTRTPKHGGSQNTLEPGVRLGSNWQNYDIVT
jgi:hypothetical protein